MKKSFIAPSLVMFLLGAIVTAMSAYILNMLETLAQRRVTSLGDRLLYFIQPLIIFSEAIVYWIIRKRNKYRKESRIHVLAFFLSFLFPVLMNTLFVFYRRFISESDLQRFVRYSTLAGSCVYWGCMVVGHIYFVRLLIKCYTRVSPASPEDVHSHNILDDLTN